MKSLVLLFAFFLSPLGEAANIPATAATPKVSFEEVPVRLENIFAPRLFVQGFFGQVVVIPTQKKELIIKAKKFLTPTPNLSPLQIQEIMRQVVVRANPSKDIVEIRAELLGTKSDWSRWAGNQLNPAVHLEITAPESMALEIYWARGNISLRNWKNSVVITNQEGHHFLGNIQGDVTARLVGGSFDLEKIQGNLTLENYDSTVNGKEILGDVRGRNFAGAVRLKQVKGAISLNSYKGTLLVENSEGKAELQGNLANIKFSDYKGALVVKTESGTINAQVKGQVNARLFSNSGPITLLVPRNSAASVIASTEKGALGLPKALEIKRTSGEKIGRGTLSGSEAGTIRVGSQNGDVVLRTF